VGSRWGSDNSYTPRITIMSATIAEHVRPLAKKPDIRPVDVIAVK
jgi:hypothetical protein